jgi:hypothetical protein
MASKVFSFSSLTQIVIPRNVEILSSSCFAFCESLSSIVFESGSHLTRIESRAFYSCSVLDAIVLPRQVEILAFECFSHCRSLSSIDFEADSVLRRIESRTFLNTNVTRVTLPGRVSFIAADAFAVGCTLMRNDAGPDFLEWDTLRRSNAGAHYRESEQNAEPH